MMLMLLLAASSALTTPNIESLQWKNRVLILGGYNQDSLTLSKQIQQFREKKKEVLDRDLVVIEIRDSGIKTWGAKHSLKLKAEELVWERELVENPLNVVLIGKDGGEKFRSKEGVVPPKKIFDLIDSMPMRVREMKKQKEKS